MKKQYPPGEWKEKREEVFANLPGHVRPDELYKEEKLYDRLLELVTGSPGLNMLQQYEDVLKKITGGPKVAEEIAAEWRGKYRNRRAMMDELGRL